LQIWGFFVLSSLYLFSAGLHQSLRCKHTLPASSASGLLLLLLLLLLWSEDASAPGAPPHSTWVAALPTHACLLEGLAPNGASTLGLPTGLLTGAGRDAMLASMAASLAATACCTSGLRRMMSSRAGPSSSVRFRSVQPRSNSDACPLGRWVLLGGPRNYRIKKSKYCKVWKNFIYFWLDSLRGASIIIWLLAKQPSAVR